MSIVVKNIGPISDSGNIELGSFNIFIGKQSSGKSTLMKILCFCQWIEKKIMTGDDKKLLYAYTHYSRFLKELKQFHRISDRFFKEQSEIHYEGECVTIDLVGKKNVKIFRKSDFEERRHNTKLCFIPSERNLVSAIRNVDRTYRSQDYDMLFNHVFEWSEAKEYTSEKNPVDLNVVGNMEYYYDAELEADVLRMQDTKETFSPFFASSGIQSVLPIIVMTNYLTGPVLSKTSVISKQDIVNLFKKLVGKGSQEEQDAALISRATRLFKYRNIRLFIEEPEQNLFPESQQALIGNIVAQINKATEMTDVPSSITIATHSPYVITAFNVLIKAAEAAAKDPDKTYQIVPQQQIVDISKVRAYFIREDGTLSDIRNTEIGMISGNELDHVSDSVEDRLNSLYEMIYG